MNVDARRSRVRWTVPIVSAVVLFAISLVHYCVVLHFCAGFALVMVGLFVAGVLLVDVSLIVFEKGHGWVQKLAACILAIVTLHVSIYPCVVHLMVFHVLQAGLVNNGFEDVERRIAWGDKAGGQLMQGDVVFWTRGKQVYVLFTINGDHEGLGFDGFLRISPHSVSSGRMNFLSGNSIEYTRLWSDWYAASGK